MRRRHETERSRPFGFEGEKQGEQRAGPFDEQRLKDERRLSRAVFKAFQKIEKNVERELRKQNRQDPIPSFKAITDVPFDEQFWGLQREEFLKEIGDNTELLLQTGLEQASALGLAVDFDLANQAVLDVAGDFTNTWWEQIATSTREQLRTAIQSHIQAETRFGQLIKSLEPTFGKVRAEMVAVTETTRLYAEGNRAAYASAGIGEVEWRTVADAAVDPICDALAGQRQILGQEAQVPPAHPRCRCWLAPVVCEDVKSVSGTKQSCRVLTEVVEEVTTPGYIQDLDDLAPKSGTFGAVDRAADQARTVLKERWGANEAFKKVAQSARRWSSASGPIRQGSANLLRGIPSGVARVAEDAAKVLMEAVSRSPVQNKLLFRGMNFGARTPIDEILATYKQGTVIDIPLSSTSFDKKVAQYFANGQKKSAVGNTRRLIMEFEDTQGLTITPFSKFAGQELEALIGGRFQVVAVRKGPAYITVRLKQIGSLP